MKIKGKKAQVQITLLPEVIIKARNLGLNISKITENSLKQAIIALEQTKSQSNRFSLSEDSLFGKRESSVVGRTGFEPATFCTSSRCPNQTRRPAL